MKIAIHLSPNSFSERWVRYCEQNHIPFKLVNCYQTNIIQQLEDCDALLWHHYQASPKDLLFAKELLFSLEQAGKTVFPNFNTGWHFDDKLGQKYLLEALNIPLVPSYAFFSKEEALDWARNTTFPKVFKLRRGAGSQTVQLARNRQKAEQLIRQAFSKGFPLYDPLSNLKERWRKYRAGKTTLTDVVKGVARLAYRPQFTKVAGNEKGYAYFQDFIPENDCDIRVIVIGERAFAIKRPVRPNDFRASGGGEILYEKKHFDESTIGLSFEIAEKLKSQCVAFDFVYLQGNPLLVEISYGFSHTAYDHCTGYWDKALNWHEGKVYPQEWIIEEVL